MRLSNMIVQETTKNEFVIGMLLTLGLHRASESMLKGYTPCESLVHPALRVRSDEAVCPAVLSTCCYQGAASYGVAAATEELAPWICLSREIPSSVLTTIRS